MEPWKDTIPGVNKWNDQILKLDISFLVMRAGELNSGSDILHSNINMTLILHDLNFLQIHRLLYYMIH